MTMLKEVTQTALLRRWPPQLYARLCDQLQDTPDQTDEAAAILLELIQSPHIPLLYEYLLQLTVNPKSLLPLGKLLRIWSEENVLQRTDATKGVMAYLSKGFQDLTAPFDDPVTAADSILGLAQQGKNGSVESDFMVTSLGASPLAPLILASVPTLASDLRKIDIRYANAFGPSRAHEDNQKLSYTPGRTFRLLWLDEFISNCVLFPGNQLFSEQLDILWPSEKTSTLAYELALTAFDAYASALTLKNRASIWEQFVGKKLPLILRFLANGQPLDNALTRLLTTMDKEVANAADQREARLNFTRTCIDLGLCDSSVLHVLHRNYQPHPENLDYILDIPAKDIGRMLSSSETLSYSQSLVVRLVDSLPEMKPLAMEVAAKELHKFVRNPRASLRQLCWMSVAFLNKIESCDALSMYVPIKSVLDNLVKRLESASSQTDTMVTIQLYGDVGGILMFVRLLLERYEIHVTTAEQQSSWALKQLFQEPSMYSNFEDMAYPVQELLGSWINALVGGRGFTDECLRSPVEVFELFPALIKQLVLAYEEKVISLETLNMSLDHLLQPSLALSLTPILQTVLYNIWAQLNSNGNLEVLRYLLAGIERRSASPELRAVINIAAPLFEQFSNLNIKATDVEQLIGKLVARAQPITFSKPEIKGSFVYALQSTLKGIVQWQSEPVGIPVIDSRLFEMGIKYFGTSEMMRLTVENIEGPPSSKTEVEVAIVVLYFSRLVKRVSSTNLVPSGAFAELVTELATEYVNKFHAIYEKHMDVVEELPIDDEPDASIFNVPQAAEIPVSATAEPLLEPDSSFTYGFDMDVSAPMGMDELDDAMNLDYFQ